LRRAYTQPPVAIQAPKLLIEIAAEARLNRRGLATAILCPHSVRRAPVFAGSISPTR
jgi:hypothetical protein